MKKFKKSKKRLQKEQETEKEEEKGIKLTKTAWMGIFIVAIMILSVIGFMWKGNKLQELEYNGYSFRLTQDRLWQMDYNGQKVVFYNQPSEVEYLEMDPSASAALRNARMIYATSDPDDLFRDAIGGVEFEINNVMGKKGTYFVYAFTKENEFNKTIITCENATAAIPVMLFKKSNRTGIFYGNNCLSIESDSAYGFRNLRDRLLYAFLGVIE